MQIPRLLCVVLLALPAAAAESDSKAIFAKHWQVAKEFTLAVSEAMNHKLAEAQLFRVGLVSRPRTRTVVRARPEPRRSPSPLRATGRRPSSFSPLLLTSAPKRLMP